MQKEHLSQRNGKSCNIRYVVDFCIKLLHVDGEKLAYGIDCAGAGREKCRR